METEKPNSEPKREIAQTDKQGGESQKQEAAPPPVSEPLHTEAEGRETGEPKEQVDRKQNEELASIAAQTMWMEQQTGWMAQQTKFIKRQFWAALALGVLTFLVLFYQAWTMGGQLESMNSTTQQTQEMLRAAQKQADASTIQANTSQSIAEQNKELVAHAGEQAKASQAQAQAATDQAKASLAQAEAAKQSVGIAASAARAAEQSARAATQTFTISERPYITIKGGSMLEFATGRPVRAVMSYVNSGKTPAFGVSVRTSIDIRLTDIPEPEQTITNIYGVGTEAFMATGDLRFGFVETNWVLPATAVEAIKQGKMWIYVYAIVNYRDSSRASHFTQYCGRFNPAMNSFDLCGIYNNAN